MADLWMTYEDGLHRSVQSPAGYLWCTNYIDLLNHASPAQPLSIPLGGDACAHVSEGRTMEFHNSPNRVEMVSVLCTFTCSINLYHFHGTSAVFTISGSMQ